LFFSLLEMGLDAETVAMAMEVLGVEDQAQLVTFVTEFQNIVQRPEKFPKEQIKHALLLYDNDFSKALEFLQECEKLLRTLGVQQEQILDAFSMFNNNIKQASEYLTTYKKLKEFGFDDVKIKEALVMCNNDHEKSVQYLLENS